MNTNDLINRLSLLSPEERDLPLFTYNHTYGMWFPLEEQDLDLSKDVIWHHIALKKDLCEWTNDSLFGDDVLVEYLKFV